MKPQPKIITHYDQGDVIAGDLGCLWCNHSRVAFRQIKTGETTILSLKSRQQPIIRKLTGDELAKFLTGEITSSKLI